MTEKSEAFLKVFKNFFENAVEALPKKSKFMNKLGNAMRASVIKKQ